MRIVDIAVKKVYRFNCPNCQSRLEADSSELVDIGGKVNKFYCPICRKDRYISRRKFVRKSSMRVRKNNKLLYERSANYGQIEENQHDS